MTSASARPSVAVLLATYNGAAYLEELLESVLAQTHPSLHVYVRDDGSADRTREILRQYEGSRLTVVLDDRGRLRSAGSFIELLSAARADIYMFCDQDDVWLPTKVADAVALVMANGGIASPVLAHTDLVVVDRSLQVVSPSFHAHDGITMPSAQELRHLVVQNCVVGCTTAVTEELVARSRLRERQPGTVAMHDWWLALYAACFGSVIYSGEARILYRQHGNNVSGARRRGFAARVRHQLSAAGVEAVNAYRRKVARQAESFLEFYGEELPTEARPYFEAAAGLDRGTGLAGVMRCAARGVRLQSPVMNASIIYSALAGIARREPRR